MADRIAIKRLTVSDCTLFESVFRKIGAGNQKSINLNADVLTGRLYPSLALGAAQTNTEIAVALTIHGPNAKGAHKLARKIIKNATYKNWRLNGEFISGPLDDSGRYDKIGPDDLAVMVFKGDLAPTAMDMFLISARDPADTSLHAALLALFGNKSMIVATSAQIAAAAAAAAVDASHPIFLAAADPDMDAALEDAAYGGAEGAKKLLTSNRSRKISAIDLAKARAKAELTGQDREGLVNGYLAARVESGAISGFAWASEENAIAPYDFRAVDNSGDHILIDVKSTSGPFDNVIHMSLAEIIEASGEVPYHIYRVFDLSDNGGKLRVSTDIRPLATLLKGLHEAHIPAGIRVDGFSMATSAVTWGPEIHIERQDE